MGSVGSNATYRRANSTAGSLQETAGTLSEREQLKIEFYKTYDVMTGVRIAATLGGFFSLIILLLVYKSRCKSSKQLEDPRLTAAAAAAVAEAEAEERALAAALEAIARMPPRTDRGPRRSLCVEMNEARTARFSFLAGYESLAPGLAKRHNLPVLEQQQQQQHQLQQLQQQQRRCSSVTCSSTGSSYLERRGSAMPVPCLPMPVGAVFPRHREPWDLYYPIDIQVIQPTPELSPCTSEAVLHLQTPKHPARRAPLASMGSVDPPEQDSKSLGSDSVFLRNEETHVDTEDEVSGFSTDSEAAGPSASRKFLRVPLKGGRRGVEKWDGCEGCVPRRRLNGRPCQICLSISATVEETKCEALHLSKSSNSSASQGSNSSASSSSTASSPVIELRQRPSLQAPGLWSQETLF